ncbi:eIF-2-alpha kinase GCN2 [Linum perenne]
MGHSSKKKKKKGGSGRRNKDHSSTSSDGNELLSEEITALTAIFQEDCKIVMGPPTQIIIKIRPHSKDMGFEDLDISVQLSVRCLPGYPYKSPKLKINPEKGLSENDLENLLSLLQEQANSNAREGRVMIFNLVEAAQEFLSQIVPPEPEPKSVLCSTLDTTTQLFQKEFSVSDNKNCFSTTPYVYGFLDLFSGSGESWHWGLPLDDNRVIKSLPSDASKVRSDVSGVKLDRTEPAADQAKKQSPFPSPVTKLDTLEEDSEDGNNSNFNTDTSSSVIDQLIGHEMKGSNEDSFDSEQVSTDDNDNSENDQQKSVSFITFDHDLASQAIEKELIMVHLLRLATTSKGLPVDGFPNIITELCNLGVLSEKVQELATKPSPIFATTFEHVFQKQLVSSRVPQFWKPPLDLEGPTTSMPNSRYLSDFEELRPLGHGGFGHVVLCKNKLDGRQYAVKKIRLKDKNLPVDDRILREVATLSRLQHQHVVRYYQAWFETGVAGSVDDIGWGSSTAASSTFSRQGAYSANVGQDSKLESTYLYIQMEYCPRTLRQVFESYNHFDKDLAWHWFRQIVEGIAHIHGQGIIHRDLTPNNIFFDARNEIKIGDFGLAKFLMLEQLDPEVVLPLDPATGMSVDGTGQIGTYFYTAPEIEQGWPKINEKVDMYSLGIVFFELWHPFGTSMERHIILSDLKQKGDFPPPWVAQFPEQASLLLRLISPSPSERPSATDLLKHAFPPRMESELLDSVLRTMQSVEDRTVYDKVVDAIFDEEMISMRSSNQLAGTSRNSRDQTPSIQYVDAITELRDYVVETTKEVFKLHCAKHFEITPLRLLDDPPELNRRSMVKLLSHGGDLLGLCHELRFPFASWLIANQKSSFKRYEISHVYRRAIGHSPPNRYLQGDFDIVGGASALTEAEIIKVTMDTLTPFFMSDRCDIHLNHGDLLDAIWSWVGIKPENRQRVGELLSMMASSRPQSSERKLKWVVIRRQLLQELNLQEAVVDRLQTVGLRFCGPVDQALARLRGALLADKATWRALDNLLDLFIHLKVWKIESQVYIDPLMPPTEKYHRNLFFQVYLMADNNPSSLGEGILLAVGGRYDYLLRQMWSHGSTSNPPGAVGTSLALETIILRATGDIKHIRNEVHGTSVLVCSRGGGGLLVERMELVAQLWEENIKAEFVPTPDPSLTEQYEYANEHDIRCLVIITDVSVSQVRHLELKKEKEVKRETLVRFLLDAMATQFRNPCVWNKADEAGV